MSRIDLPSNRNKVQTDFFARNAESVARDLLGRTLVVNGTRDTTLYAVLREVAAYEGDREDSMTEEANNAPGTVSISTKYGKRLLDVSTGESGVPSCITLISADIHDQRGFRDRARGPGKLTEMLGIENHYGGIVIPSGELWVSGESTYPSVKKRNLKNQPRNLVGKFYF